MKDTLQPTCKPARSYNQGTRSTWIQPADLKWFGEGHLCFKQSFTQVTNTNIINISRDIPFSSSMMNSEWGKTVAINAASCISKKKN